MYGEVSFPMLTTSGYDADLLNEKGNSYLYPPITTNSQCDYGCWASRHCIVVACGQCVLRCCGEKLISSATLPPLDESEIRFFATVRLLFHLFHVLHVAGITVVCRYTGNEFVRYLQQCTLGLCSFDMQSMPRPLQKC